MICGPDASARSRSALLAHIYQRSAAHCCDPVPAQPRRVEKTITEPALARSVRKEAIPDVITRAQTVWLLDDDGKLVASTPDGGRTYHSDGDRPLLPETWVNNLQTTAPHLFEASTVGGASDGGASDGNVLRVRAKADLKSAKDESEFIARHGYDAFAKLPLNARL
jgi:hypothetical protein